MNVLCVVVNMHSLFIYNFIYNLRIEYKNIIYIIFIYIIYINAKTEEKS
jgi:hypothetical protein